MNVPANLPQTTSQQTQLSAPCLPDRLNALLASGENPIVGPETAGQLAAFAAIPEPPLASKAQVEVMIGKLAMATAQGKSSLAEASERLDLYWLALNDVPVDDLRGGFAQLLRTAKFLPTPAEVRSASVKHGAHRKYLKSRARHLAWLHKRDWQPAVEYVKPEELASLMPNLSADRD